MPQAAEAKARIRLLGGFELTTPQGASVAISGRKAQGLLAILALSPGMAASRDRLAGLLWGDRGDEQARNSLRQALVALKKELGDAGLDFLEAERDQVRLRADRVSVDAAEFEKLAKAGEVVKAAALYGGALLDGVLVRDAAFEEWAAGERQRRADLAFEVFERVFEAASGPERLAAARRLLALDPLREVAHRAVMQALAASGERDQALRQYESCRDMLARELGTEPSAETERLKVAIAAGEDQTMSMPVSSGTAGSTAHVHEEPSIAVLPFTSLSDDTEQAYFADGISADIISELGRFGELMVTAASSSFSFKGQSLAIGDIAARLGVKYLVEGSVRRAGDRVRITVQLIEGASGNRIWGERYDRDLSDIFAVQDEIASSVATAVAGGIQRLGANRAQRLPTENLGAYECYLRARVLQNHYDGFAKGLPFVKKAIELDPGFALAQAALSTLQLVEYLYTSDPRDHEPALASARKALLLDPQEAACQSALGHALIFTGRLDESQAHFNKALELNRNYVWARMLRGECSMYQGKHDAAMADIDECFRRDPYPADWFWDVRGMALVSAGRDEEALATYARMAAVPPWGHWYMAISYLRLGDAAKARDAIAVYMAFDPQGSTTKALSTDPYIPEIKESLRAALIAAGMPA